MLAGELLAGKYRIIRSLGSGGMGTVFEARHEGLGACVAVKVLHPEVAEDPDAVERLFVEARAAAAIDDPHVVRVLDADRAPDGMPFVVYERIDGITLAHLTEDLKAQGAWIDRDDAIAYALQIIEGVAAAHRAGVIHRDLKPANVMVAEDAHGAPRLVVLDFGIAKIPASTGRKLTAPGTILGTPAYMAPEQVFEPHRVDARADVFALGVILYELFAQQLPVAASNPLSIAASYLGAAYPPLAELAPSIDPALAAVVARAMSPEPKERYASAVELREALLPFARSHRALAASPPEHEEAVARSGTMRAALPPTLAGTLATSRPRGSGTVLVAPQFGPEDAERISATVIDEPAPIPKHGAPGRPLSFALIVALATVIAALVTGGVYVAAQSDDDDASEAPIPLPRPAAPAPVKATTASPSTGVPSAPAPQPKPTVKPAPPKPKPSAPPPLPPMTIRVPPPPISPRPRIIIVQPKPSASSRKRQAPPRE